MVSGKSGATSRGSFCGVRYEPRNEPFRGGNTATGPTYCPMRPFICSWKQVTRAGYNGHAEDNSG